MSLSIATITNVAPPFSFVSGEPAVAGPYRVVATQCFVAGMQRAEVFLAGASQSESFVAGSQQSEVAR